MFFNLFFLTNADGGNRMKCSCSRPKFIHVLTMTRWASTSGTVIGVSSFLRRHLLF